MLSSPRLEGHGLLSSGPVHSACLSCIFAGRRDRVHPPARANFQLLRSRPPYA
jgi:hypothetical protein